jgi:predicted nucleic acid-binding protein
MANNGQLPERFTISAQVLNETLAVLAKTLTWEQSNPTITKIQEDVRPLEAAAPTRPLQKSEGIPEMENEQAQ